MLILSNSGGAVGAEALADYVKKREGGNEKHGAGEIHRLVYCCAFCLQAGTSLMHGLGNQPLPWFDIKVYLFFALLSL